MSNRISLDRENVDRMILLGMDADRYRTQVIPDLQQRVFGLTRALSDLVAPLRAEQKIGGPAGQVTDALARAQKVIEAGLLSTRGGQP